MKIYDSEKVEQLLEWVVDGQDDIDPRLDALAAAIRSSAREAGEVSDKEIIGLVEAIAADPRLCALPREPLGFAFNCVRAALARFGAPRGKIVEGWYAWIVDGEILDFTDNQLDLPKDFGQKSVPCRIEILDAPSAEEGK